MTLSLEDTAQAIVVRWHRLFNGTEISQKFINQEPLEPFEQEALNTMVESWRARLHNIRNEKQILILTEFTGTLYCRFNVQ